LALSKEIKNVWADISSTICLTFGLLDAGASEEALVLTQPAIALARTLPPMLSFQRLLAALGGTYQALQQWEEARSTLEEAEAMHRLGEGLGPSPRFRIPYLQSLAVLAAWDGESEQAIGHLHEAAGLAADLGLPGERWQIQAALGRVYKAAGDAMQARMAFEEAARIIQGLAEGIKDEALRARF